MYNAFLGKLPNREHPYWNSRLVRSTLVLLILASATSLSEASWTRKYSGTIENTYLSGLYLGGLSHSTPVFIDMDQDQDPDLFIGSQSGEIVLFKNAGIPQHPIWDTPVIFKLNGSLTNTAPTLGDLDQDSDMDMVVGTASGALIYFENIGTPDSPNWDAGTVLHIFVATHPSPQLADIDGDTDLDLFVGLDDGTIQLLTNTGTPSAPTWDTPGTPNYAAIDVDQFAHPAFIDIDGDTDYDLFVGNEEGHLTFAENTGTDSSPQWNIRTDRYNDIDVGDFGAPTFTDLDGDQDIDLLLGNKAGSLTLLINKQHYLNTLDRSALENNLLLYYSFDVDQGSSVLDESPSLNHGTVSGATHTLDGQSGGAYKFETNDYILANDSTLPELAEPRTISYWAKWNRLPAQSSAFNFSYGLNADNKWFALGVDGNLNRNTPFFSPNHTPVWGNSSLQIETWHHIVYTYDGTIQKLFIDGEEKTGITILTALNTQLSGTLRIGNQQPNGDGTFQGLIDELRIYGRALPQSEINLLYNYHPLLDHRLSLYYNFDQPPTGGTVTDISTNNYDGVATAITAQSAGPQSGFYEFNGTSSSIDHAYNPSEDLFPSDPPFSVSVWFKSTGTGNLSNPPVLLGTHVGGTVNGYLMYIYYSAADSPHRRLSWRMDIKDGFEDGLAVTQNIFSREPVNDGLWHHAVGVWADGKTSLYLDGKLQGERLEPGTLSYSSGVSFKVGDLNGRNYYHFTGGLDEVRVYRRKLSPIEIQQLYLGTPSAAIDWSAPQSNNHYLDQGLNSHPVLADVDGDHDQDLFIGSENGTITHYANIGSPHHPTWQKQPSSLTQIQEGDAIAPMLADLNGDGDHDLLVGKSDGTIDYYENKSQDAKNSTTLQNNLILYYAFENPTSNFITDLSGNEYHANNMGASAVADPCIGGVLYFDGIQSHLETIDHIPLDNRSFSWSFWVKRNSSFSGAQLPILYQGLNVRQKRFMVGFDFNDVFKFTFGDSGQRTLGYVDDQHEWHHWAGTYDYSTHEKVVYRDGIRVNTVPPGTYIGPTNYLGTGTLFIGQDNNYNGAVVNFNGHLDEIRLYERVLSYDEILALYSIHAPAGVVFPETPSTHFANINLVNPVFPSFSDTDGDLDLDLYLGTTTGIVHHIENVGTPTLPSWAALTPDTFNVFSNTPITPASADMDGDGDLDFLVGLNNGTLTYWENTGTLEIPVWETPVTPFFNIQVGQRATPILTDLNGDQKVDLLIGEQDGGINLWLQQQSPLFILPSSRTLISGEEVTLSTNDEDINNSWEIIDNQTGGTINPSSGLYTAGAVAGIDIIRMTDPLGQLSYAYINVIHQNETLITSKAIIIAGRNNADDPLWTATSLLADKAFNTLRYLGYTKDQIQYHSRVLDADVDANGLLDDIDGYTTLNTLSQTFTNWAQDANNLFVYLVAHGKDTAESALIQINETETLTGTQLNNWITDLENNLNITVTIVIDSCYSGGFIPDLAGGSSPPNPPGEEGLTPPRLANRRVITSSSSTQLTYFLSGGAISFSSIFFDALIQGFDLEQAYLSARTSMQQYHLGEIDGNSDGVSDLPLDHQLLAGIYLGPGLNVAGKNRPAIGSFMPNQILDGEQSTVLWVGDITSQYPIQSVTARITPPGVNPNDTTNPFIKTINLYYNPNNDTYDVPWNAFTLAGTYSIQIQATDTWGSASPPATVFVTQLQNPEKIILLSSGGPATTPERAAAISNITQRVYNTFLNRGFDTTQIQVLSHYLNQDLNDDGLNDVDGAPTLTELDSALSTWSADAEKLILYLIGEADGDAFLLEASAPLTATALTTRLDNWQGTDKEILLIIEAPYSELFIPNTSSALAPRTILTSSDSQNDTLWAANGFISFSGFFSTYIFNGYSVGDAFIRAKQAVRNASGQLLLEPAIEASGNQIPNETPDDLTYPMNLYIGPPLLQNQEAPIASSVAPDAVLIDTNRI